MLKRTANVSIVHRASLAGMESQIRINFGIEGVQYHDTVIYHALIQAGVHSIRRIDSHSQQHQDFVTRERITASDDGEYFKLLREIQGLLEKHAINEKQSAEQNKLFTLSLFLTDLIYSLQTDAAMVTVLPRPKIDNYYGRISPHFLSAIGSLLSNITTTEVLAPIPQLTVKASEVKVFEELMESQIFTAYSNAHSEFASIRESDVAVLNDVSMRAKTIWQRYSNTVDLKKLSLSLIPITKTMADKVLTGLPGTIVGLIADALTTAAQQEKRIVIYDYGRSHQDLLMAHYEKLSRLQFKRKED